MKDLKQIMCGVADRVRFLRDERTFSDLGELKKQVVRACAADRQWRTGS